MLLKLQYCKDQDFGQLASKATRVCQWSEWECSGQSGNAVPSTESTANPPWEVQVQFTDLQAKKSPFHTHLVFQIPKPNQIWTVSFHCGSKTHSEEQCSLVWGILNNCTLKPKKRISCVSWNYSFLPLPSRSALCPAGLSSTCHLICGTTKNAWF